MSWIKYSLMILALIAAIALIGEGLFFYNSRTAKAEVYSTTHTVASVLLQRNSDFSLAETYRSQKEYQKALDYYQKALLKSEDVSQEAQIKFDIALMTGVLGNYTDAIQMYKQIAANPEYYSVVRAYAVQEIARMNSNYYGQRAAIRAETFKGQPYASFLENDDYVAAYTKLFQYAASIYPLALSESYVAYGFVKDLSAINGATTTTQGSSDVRIITQALRGAKSDISRMQQVPREASDLPAVFSREAVVIGYLVTYGVPGYTLSQAEELYKKALVQNAATGGSSGNFFAFHYAVFLAQNYPETRRNDLKEVLSVFSAENSSMDPNVPAFYKAILTDPAQALEKKYTALLGRLDPDFKVYLMSLGWSENDFAPSTTL